MWSGQSSSTHLFSIPEQKPWFKLHLHFQITVSKNFSKTIWRGKIPVLWEHGRWPKMYWSTERRSFSVGRLSIAAFSVSVGMAVMVLGCQKWLGNVLLALQTWITSPIHYSGLHDAPCNIISSLHSLLQWSLSPRNSNFCRNIQRERPCL